MGYTFSPLGSWFDQNTFGISIRDGLWHLSGGRRTPVNDERGRRWVEAAGYDLSTFVTKLTAEANMRWPSLLFGRTEEIILFLDLDDPRLGHLQQYVHRLRQTKNIIVCSDAEVRAYAGLPASNLDPESGEAVHGWYRSLMRMTSSPAIMGQNLCDLLEPNHWMLQHNVPDEALVEFWLHRYLAMSDRVLRALDDESAGMSLREAAGVDDLGEEIRLLFIPDRTESTPFFTEPSAERAARAMDEPGRVLALEQHVAPCLAEDAFRCTPMRVPFDVLAAA